MKRAGHFLTLVLALGLLAAVPVSAAEVLEGDANVDQRNYPSTAPFIHPPFYNARVKVEVDDEGVILSVTDNGTGEVPSVEEGNEEFWQNKNKPYWDVAAASFENYTGKTLDEVKAMDPLGADAVSGATMAGAAIHEAVINAFEGKAGKTFLPGTGTLLPVETAENGTIVMNSLLPEDFDAQVLDIRYGVYNAEEDILPADSYEAEFADGKLVITLADPEAAKPGKYYVNVVDQSGTYRSPHFEAGHGEESGAQAGYFVLPCSADEAVSMEDGKIVLAEGSVQDYMKNIEHVMITAEGAEESVEQEPVGHHGTVNSGYVVFDGDGVFHPEAELKARDGSVTPLFEEGTAYTVEISAFGYPEFTFSYPEAEAAAEAVAEAPAEEAADAQEEPAAAPAGDLSAWYGEWRSIKSWWEDVDVQAAITETAEMTGVDAAELKAQYEEMFSTNFPSLIISEEGIDFGTREVVPYRHAGVLDNGFDLFVAEGETDWPYLAMTAPEMAATEEGMDHFHYRYGTSVLDLMTEEPWYPTVVPEDTTGKQIYNGLMEFGKENAGAGEEAAEEADDAEAAALLEDVKGTYEELFTVICDPAYDEIWLDCCEEVLGAEMAPEAARMLKEACTGEIYGEEAVAAYGDGSEGARFDCFFIGDVAQFVFDGSLITGLDADGAEIFSNEYAYAGPFSIGGMMDGFLYETDAEDAGDFRYFFLLPDTPDTTYHIEFRYGADLEDLEKYNEGSLAYWLAAGIPTDRSEDLVEDVITLFCTENLAE